MTAYFISPNGSDSNNGLGPDASDGTNKPWLTVGKSLNTGSPVSPGDTVHIAPGYYFSSSMTPIAGVSSVADPTLLLGDPLNAQGFKDGSGVRLAPGLPWVSARTSGAGIDGPSASGGSLFTPGTNACHGLQARRIVFESRPINSLFLLNLSMQTDWLFDDCVLLVGNVLQTLGSSVPTAGRNHRARGCLIICQRLYSFGPLAAAATADADLNIVFEENLIFGQFANVATGISASGGNLAGGIYLLHNTLVPCAGQFLSTVAGQVSTVKPIVATGNLFITFSGSTGWIAGTSGQIIDGGFNRFIGTVTGHTNVTPAGTSVFGVAPNLVLPHLVKWGLEMPRADFLGWTDAAHADQKFSASGATTPDFFGRTARPWGAGASIGCMQALAVVQDTSSAITGGGANSIKLTGAGEISFFLPVTAASTVIKITTKSASYGGTNYPQLIVQPSPEIGVAGATATATDASEQEVATSAFTPTAPGVVEVRLVSRSSTVTSSTFFDLLTVTP